MVKERIYLLAMLLIWMGWLAGSATQKSPVQSGDRPRVLAVETFLADMAQNVAGERLKVGALMPIGLDPHAFQPTPADVAKIADCQVLIVNGTGFEVWLDETSRMLVVITLW